MACSPSSPSELVRGHPLRRLHFVCLARVLCVALAAFGCTFRIETLVDLLFLSTMVLLFSCWTSGLMARYTLICR